MEDWTQAFSEEWDAVVRAMVVWATGHDPVRKTDPTGGEDLSKMFSRWNAMFGSQPISSATILQSFQPCHSYFFNLLH